MPESTTRVGSVVRRLRERNGTSLREAARLAGMSAAQLQRVESLASEPSEGKIRGLARAFGVPVSSLFGEGTSNADAHAAIPQSGIGQSARAALAAAGIAASPTTADAT